MNVCVYCASSNNIAGEYFDLARTLGAGLAQRDWRLVYGGGSVGLMGELALAVHAHGGVVIGIIPQSLLDLEIGYLQADELIVTTTLRERKALMESHADAFVTLPGGFGTLEELLEMITLKQIRYHEKPIIIVNAYGFFNPLLAQFERTFVEGFATKPFVDGVEGSAETNQLYWVVDSVDAALDVLAAQRLSHTADR